MLEIGHDPPFADPSSFFEEPSTLRPRHGTVSYGSGDFFSPTQDEYTVSVSTRISFSMSRAGRISSLHIDLDYLLAAIILGKHGCAWEDLFPVMTENHDGALDGILFDLLSVDIQGYLVDQVGGDVDHFHRLHASGRSDYYFEQRMQTCSGLTTPPDPWKCRPLNAMLVDASSDIMDAERRSRR